MRTLAWMQRRFGKIDEKSRNVSTRKSYSCFSALWELDEQQHYHGAEMVNEEEIVEMGPEFFHGFLAIGTLGFVSITEETITPKSAMSIIETEKETVAEENELQGVNKKLEKLTEKEVHDESNECPLKEYSEIPPTKKEEKQQKTKAHNLFKKKITGKSDNGENRETRALHFMKKMLKKLDFASRCSPTSASGKDIFCDSTENKPTKVLWKSRKVHPEAADIHVNNLHNYEVKVCYDEGYDKNVTLEDKDKLFANRSINSLPAGKKEHWIKTDADYFVLEF